MRIVSAIIFSGLLFFSLSPRYISCEDDEFFLIERYNMEEYSKVDWNYATFIDFDSDGDMDIVLSAWAFNTDGTTPVIALENDGYGRFDEVTSSVFKSPHSYGSQRRPMVADFNGDGLQDIYFYAMGNEGGQDLPTWWTGQKDQMFYQDKKGMLIDSSSKAFPDGRRGISHSSIFGDIDGDGDLDILNINLGGRGNPIGTHFYINNGKGVFSVDTSRLPSFFRDHEVNGWPNNGAFADVDNDGDLDVMIFVDVTDNNKPEGETSEPAFRLFYNDGKGYFTMAGADAVPSRNPDETWTFYAITAADLNNDGWQDAIISNITHDLQHTKLQLLINKKNGKFKDETGKIEGNNKWKSGGWVLKIMVEDINNDGWKDLVTQGTSYPRIFVNKGSKNIGFEEATTIIEEYAKKYGPTMSAADIDNDGDIDIVTANACAKYCPELTIQKNVKHYKPTIKIKSPKRVKPQSPENNSKLKKAATFTWKYNKEATSFDLQFSTDKDFSSITYEIRVLDALEKKIDEKIWRSKFKKKTQYFWRMRAWDKGLGSKWSKVFSFTR